MCCFAYKETLCVVLFGEEVEEQGRRGRYCFYIHLCLQEAILLSIYSTLCKISLQAWGKFALKGQILYSPLTYSPSTYLV